ncbi:hypothetical protein MKX01_000330 [Papaver californicum]|nr:hypothetical protein MKX01_000330 [Papaver californicum]
MEKVISMVQAFLRPRLLVLVLIGMTQIVGAQIETEVNCSADKFYNMFRNNAIQMATIFPNYFKSVKIIKGDGKSLGSIRQWQYVTLGMKTDQTNPNIILFYQSITFSVLGGDLLTHYKSFDFQMTVSPKYIDNIEESGSKVKWWIQYEKRAEDVPSPDAHIGLIAPITKELGHYLLKQ